MHNKAWHEKRRKGIGGSDVNSILNLEPYGCARRLYYEKKGVETDWPESYNPHTARGHGLEPLAVKMYIEATNNEIASVRQSMTGANKISRGEIDGLICTSNRADDGVLEVKCPARDNFYKWQQEGLPKSHILQMQHYLYVFDLKWGDYAIFNADLWDVKVFRVMRDQELIDMILEKEMQFWAIVKSATIPDQLEMGDKRCKTCLRRKTCWQEQLEIMERTVIDVDNIPREETHGVFNDQIERFNEAKTQIDFWENVKDDQKGLLKAFMKENSIVNCGGLQVKNKSTRGRKTFDINSFEKDHPELAEEYTRDGAPYKVFTIKELKQ